ncbi:MAG: SRPBCC family protein [Gammaproteobacteria bacterium]|nr:SRPBCC family protein [Gammaproteobacteria bacterium]
MNFSLSIDIQASRERVWQVISGIDNAVNVISGIEKLDILEQPEDGLVGLKWEETRTLFGKTATEIMWVTNAEENSYYQTRAESHDSVYITRLSLEENNGMTTYTMRFSGEPQTFGGKVMMKLMGWMFVKATRDCLQQDLEDIKAYAEQDNATNAL